jgi:hypothetical protein
MVPVAEAFNVLRLFLKAIQNLGPNLPSKVDQDRNWKTKASENFLEFTSIGVILQHGSGVARGDIHQKLYVDPLLLSSQSLTIKSRNSSVTKKWY